MPVGVDNFRIVTLLGPTTDDYPKLVIKRSYYVPKIYAPVGYDIMKWTLVFIVGCLAGYGISTIVTTVI